MALQVGDQAPRFELPQGPGEMVDVGAAFDQGRTVSRRYWYDRKPCSLEKNNTGGSQRLRHFESAFLRSKLSTAATQLGI